MNWIKADIFLSNCEKVINNWSYLHVFGNIVACVTQFACNLFHSIDNFGSSGNTGNEVLFFYLSLFSLFSLVSV